MGNSDTLRLLCEVEGTASRLNAAFDDLNTFLETIQQRLNESGIGLEVWVPIEQTRLVIREDERAGFRIWDESQLGYGRFGDAWGLLTRRGHFEETPDRYETYDEPKPLLRSGRELRVHATHTLPALFAALQSEASRMLGRVKEAKQLTQDYPGPAAQDTGTKPACLWCHVEQTSTRRLDMAQPRECPACDHVFEGKGWDGIDAHWKAEHEHQYGLSYDEFWTGILRCVRHWR